MLSLVEDDTKMKDPLLLVKSVDKAGIKPVALKAWKFDPVIVIFEKIAKILSVLSEAVLP